MSDSTHTFNALARCPAFSELTETALDLLRRRCTERTFHAGERVIRQGDPGDSLLVVLDGRLSATVHDEEHGPRRVGEFEPFDVVGEMSIVTGEPRTADVIAEEPGRALVLSEDVFRDAARDYPELNIVLTRIVAERLGRTGADGLGGKTVDRYRIHRGIGRGGMAMVYEARDLETNEAVALKMMSHRLIYEHGSLARFQREADILLALDHANVARVRRTFSAYRTGFIAMDLCDGCDLGALIANGYRPDEKDLRRTAGQLAAGLAYLHAQGVVHRDMKTRNVLVDRAGNLRLADFGLACSIAQPANDGPALSGTVLGTPEYMAPELFVGGETSPASDVYGLGCVLLELVTGSPVFACRDIMEMVEMKRRFAVPPRQQLGRGVSRKLHRLLQACLAPAPADRVLNLARLARWAAPLPILEPLFSTPGEPEGASS